MQDFPPHPFPAQDVPADEVALTEGITTRRVLSSVVDGIVVGLTLTALHLTLGVLGLFTFGLAWLLIGGLWALPIAYVALFAASPAQATIGQSLLGLAVVRDADLGRPTPAQAIVYALGFTVTMAAGAIWLVAAFFTRRARCLHDIVAGVAVVRAASAGGNLPEESGFIRR